MCLHVQVTPLWHVQTSNVYTYVRRELALYFIFYGHENTINQTSSALKRRRYYFLSAACTVIVVTVGRYIL